MYRMPMQHGGQMVPPPGMELGMQYFMPAEAGGGMGYVDGSQYHRHHPQAQQQQLTMLQVCRDEGVLVSTGSVRFGMFRAKCVWELLVW